MTRFLRFIYVPDLGKRTWQFLLPLLFSFLFLSIPPISVFGQGTQQDKEASVKRYDEQALRLGNAGKNDEALELLRQALQLKENAESYYYIGHIYYIRNEWSKAIENLEKSVAIDSTYLAPYSDLFYCYMRDGRWKAAQKLGEQAKRIDTKGTITSQISSNDTTLENAHRSNIMLVLFFLILAAVFFLPFYAFSKDNSRKLTYTQGLRFSDVLLVSASVNCLFYVLFYTFSAWIWAQNPHVPPNDFAPAMRAAIFEHDGVESFVMYSLVLAVMLTTIPVTIWLLKLKSNKSLYLPIFIPLLLISCYYFYKIGFFPPYPSVDPQYILLPFALAFLSIGLFILYRYNSLLSKLIVLVLVAFAGLVPLAPPSLVDFAFILDPALRLIHGFKISDIYFQYDLFLSFLAYAWMKLNIAIEWFPYLGTLSFFLFFIGVFFFSDRFFKTKGLSVMFIVAIVLVRLYVISYDNRLILQVTPLRLDLWIILILVANYKGIHHWLLGTCVGLLMLFHRNLGLIYLGAYIELLVVLFMIDLVSLAREKNMNVKALTELFVKHLRQNAKNLVIIGVSIALCFVLFKEMFSASALAYRKLGIGMIPVSDFSFYWYVPVILGCLSVLLFYYRERLGAKYVSVAFFILLLATGNSMYFFGRSHENNILNITGILVLTLFLLFDILIFLAPQSQKKPQQASPPKTKNKKTPDKGVPVNQSFITARSIYLSLPVIFIFLTGYYFSERIFDKGKTQYNNLLESNFHFPFEVVPDTAAIRQITHNSANVYFMDERYDFYYYYYGKYTPLGYYSPFGAWVFKKDVINYLQDLLDKHYYIVCTKTGMNDYGEFIPYLNYNQSSQKNDMIALKKEDVPLLLPTDTADLYHIGIKDALATVGIDHGGLNINGDFTVEVILKPLGSQVPTAAIVNNLSQFPHEGLKGFVFQLNGSTQNQYIFGFSNGTPVVPNVIFNLDNNVWHYVTATVNKESLKIYDNGKFISSANTGGASLVNSELPITIGNRSSRDCHFSGYIKEVKISKGNPDQNEISSRWQKIESELNNVNINQPVK